MADAIKILVGTLVVVLALMTLIPETTVLLAALIAAACVAPEAPVARPYGSLSIENHMNSKYLQ